MTMLHGVDFFKSGVSAIAVNATAFRRERLAFS